MALSEDFRAFALFMRTFPQCVHIAHSSVLVTQSVLWHPTEALSRHCTHSLSCKTDHRLPPSQPFYESYAPPNSVSTMCILSSLRICVLRCVVYYCMRFNGLVLATPPNLKIAQCIYWKEYLYLQFTYVICIYTYYVYTHTYRYIYIYLYIYIYILSICVLGKYEPTRLSRFGLIDWLASLFLVESKLNN